MKSLWTDFQSREVFKYHSPICTPRTCSKQQALLFTLEKGTKKCGNVVEMKFGAHHSSCTVLRMKGTLRSLIFMMLSTSDRQQVGFLDCMIDCYQLYCISISPASDRFSTSSRLEDTVKIKEFYFSNFSPHNR